MLDGDLDRAHRGTGEAEAAHRVDAVHRQIDDGHLVVAHLLHHLPGEDHRVGEEHDAYRIDQGGHDATDGLGQVAVRDVDVNVSIEPHQVRDADEDHADKKVAGDLLGPGGRVVERVAGEELVEDGDRENPEEKERDPGLEGVMREFDRRVGDVHVPRLVEHMLFRGRGGGLGFGHRIAVLKRARCAFSDESRRWIAASAGMTHPLPRADRCEPAHERMRHFIC